MTTSVDRIIKDLKQEIETRKAMIKSNEYSINKLSNECTERLEIIKKLEELKLNEK